MNDTVATIQSIVTILGFPLAIATLRHSAYQAQRGRELTALLDISKSFASRWESRWQIHMKDIDEKLFLDKFDIDNETHRAVIEMLNWIDWVGMLFKSKLIRNYSTLFSSIEPQIRLALRVGAPEIRRDQRRRGNNHWPGLIFIAEKMNITI
jgi:hypothetical protein